MEKLFPASRYLVFVNQVENWDSLRVQEENPTPASSLHPHSNPVSLILRSRLALWEQKDGDGFDIGSRRKAPTLYSQVALAVIMPSEWNLPVCL